MNIIDFENWLRPELELNVSTVKKYAKRGGTFIDVGSNTGLFTQMVLNELGYDYFDTIVMFEPIPYLVDECIKKFNDISNIKIEKLALSDTNITSVMYASNSNLGYNKIYKEGMEIHPHSKIEVECIKFDDWIINSGISNVNFIKIDAEGHDMNVIRGMFNWLSMIDVKPYIMFETNWYVDLESKFIKEMESKFGYTSITGKDCILIPNQ
jgi:FkbM family methyltransferase